MGEATPGHHEFVERTGLNDSAGVKNEDTGRLAYRRQSMRNDESRPIRHHLIERPHHLGFRVGVKRARGLIEDEDRRIFQQRARDR